MNLHRMIVRSIFEEISQIFRFIHPSDDNLETFSIGLYSLLLQAGSEFDKLLNLRLSQLDPTGSIGNADKRKDAFNRLQIENSFVEFIDWTSERRFDPFLDWGQGNELQWFTRYGNSKHDPKNLIQHATLNNVLLAASS
jgi:hypothetical protein